MVVDFGEAAVVVSVVGMVAVLEALAEVLLEAAELVVSPVQVLVPRAVAVRMLQDFLLDKMELVEYITMVGAVVAVAVVLRVVGVVHLQVQAAMPVHQDHLVAALDLKFKILLEELLAARPTFIIEQVLHQAANLKPLLAILKVMVKTVTQYLCSKYLTYM
jgi:hypothetical protein